MTSGASSLSAFHDDLLERGTLFTVLFYFLVTALILSVAAALYEGLVESELLAFSYALLFGGLSTYFFQKKDVYPLLVVAVFPIYAITFVLGFNSLPNVVAAVGPLATYVVVGVAMLVFGAVPAYLFREISPDILYYLTVAVYGSSVIAILAGMLTALTTVVQVLQANSRAPRILLGVSDSVVATAQVVDPVLLFGIAFVLFNAPFLVYARRREDFDVMLVPLYLGPLILYGLIRASVSTAVS
ncbi:MAG: hypothetical protein SVW02_04125 [Candidatus Nanohaloarchaea archaeon]|nr:hypothetical protein [Candidatus Nanohaloarchaea archaeon]